MLALRERRVWIVPNFERATITYGPASGQSFLEEYRMKIAPASGRVWNASLIRAA